MADNPPGSVAAPATLKAGALHWLEVAALGIAIAISGNVSGWNYGLGVGGWGGMLLAALAMAVLFLCLTQTLAELAAALPDAGGFDGYVRRALGPTAAYLTGMSVAIALAVGAGLAMSFGEAYVSAWLGVGGWPVKLVFLLVVMGLQLRGAGEAVGLTVAVGVVALVILVAFCLFMAPEYQSARLFSAGPDGARTLLPHGLGGAARCIPFALFLFLGVEQAGHAAAEMRDMARNMPKALATAIGVAFVIGMCVLLIATGGTGADRLAAVDDPLFAAVTANPGRNGILFMTRLVGAGALVALLGTFFSIAYAGSRQFYHLAQAGFLPRMFGVVNARQAPSAAVYLVARHRTRDGGIPAEQRHGRVHILDQRLARAAARRIPAAAPARAAARAQLSGARRFTDRRGGAGTIARRDGVVLPASGARLADRHRCNRAVDRPVRMAEAGAAAALMSKGNRS